MTDADDDGMDTDMVWYRAAGSNDVEIDQLVSVQLGRVGLVLVRTTRGVSSLSNLCPHAWVPLDDGDCTDGVITCPVHQWRFDAMTGLPVGQYKGGLRRFECHEVDGDISVELPAWMVEPVKRE